jgi:DNA-binding MarR family transcriptional regulator
MAVEPTDEEYQRLAEFRAAIRRFLRFSELAARDAGLTPNQHQLLLAVRGWPGPTDPTIAEVAEMLQLRSHSVLELARRAEDAGLLERATPPEDRRRHALRLTPLGEQHLAALSVLHREELDRVGTELVAILRQFE